MLPITATYAACLVFLFVALAANVIRLRYGAHISLGFGDNPTLERRIRAHGNCAEYMPIGIVMIGLVEGLGAPLLLVHAIGSLLLAGRLLHAFALSQSTPPLRVRVLGMVLTFSSLITASVSAIVIAWLP